jgi:SAM-dependent methyltransferase
MNKPSNEMGVNKKHYVFEEKDPKHVFTNFDEIVRFDTDFWNVTKDLPIRTGSLMRLSEESFRNWRIGITPENKQLIKRLGEDFRQKDYCEKQRDSSIRTVETTDWIDMIRNGMTRAMVHYAKEVLLSLDDGKRALNVCELASGYGKVSVSLAASLLAQGSNDLLSRTRFYLVDYSEEKLKRAVEKLEPYNPAEIVTVPMSDEEFLAAFKEKSDVMLSLCHMHKRPFLGDLLEKINDSLSRKGVVISGDLHSSLPSHPMLMYQLLERMGTENRRLKLFRDMFSAFMDAKTIPASAEENRAITDHQEYWAGVYNEILSSKSTGTMRSRHYVLGAFDTTKKRVALMEDKGFIIDPDKVRRAFPKAKIGSNPVHMAPGSDRASVVLAMKGKALKG